MLLVLQILFGALAAGTGIGLIVDVAKNRKDALKSATGKQWASGFTVGIIANFLDTLGCGCLLYTSVQGCKLSHRLRNRSMRCLLFCSDHIRYQQL